MSTPRRVPRSSRHTCRAQPVRSLRGRALQMATLPKRRNARREMRSVRFVLTFAPRCAPCIRIDVRSSRKRPASLSCARRRLPDAGCCWRIARWAMRSVWTLLWRRSHREVGVLRFRRSMRAATCNFSRFRSTRVCRIHSKRSTGRLIATPYAHRTSIEEPRVGCGHATLTRCWCRQGPSTALVIASVADKGTTIASWPVCGPMRALRPSVSPVQSKSSLRCRSTPMIVRLRGSSPIAEFFAAARVESDAGTVAICRRSATIRR